jgi:hypothetical protein
MNEVKAKALELSVQSMIARPTAAEYIERARLFEAYLSEDEDDATCWNCEHKEHGTDMCLALLPDTEHGGNACRCHG